MMDEFADGTDGQHTHGQRGQIEREFGPLVRAEIGEEAENDEQYTEKKKGTISNRVTDNQFIDRDPQAEQKPPKKGHR